MTSIIGNQCIFRHQLAQCTSQPSRMHDITLIFAQMIKLAAIATVDLTHIAKPRGTVRHDLALKGSNQIRKSMFRISPDAQCVAGIGP